MKTCTVEFVEDQPGWLNEPFRPPIALDDPQLVLPGLN
jgi:hypothetical protein